MPKHEALTPKAIANRIKAKGLQKLRWYCQMCQKQCRDENGFKCHTMSESHQRQLLLFADNPHKYIDTFSKEFRDSFIELVKRRFGTKRIHANQVYQEYITDRNHLHMNATKWLTLTGFVKYLGREGICTVDETEKGWFIAWVDREPETIRRQESLARKEKLDLDDDERMAKFVEEQARRDKKKKEGKEDVVVFSELKRENEDEKLVLNMSLAPKKETDERLKASTCFVFAKPQAVEKRKPSKTIDNQAFKRSKSALDEIIEEQEKHKEKRNRKDFWLTPGIVVKVTTKELGDKYYKKKAVVEEVENQYVGFIKMLDSGDKLKIDQAYLETVIPNIGRQVLIVNGAYRNCTATLVDINMDTFSATLKIDAGPTRGRTINSIAYEDICKLNSH